MCDRDGGVDEELRMSRVETVNLGARLKALDELLSFRANATATELAGLYFPQLQLQLHLETDCQFSGKSICKSMLVLIRSKIM